MFDNMINQIKMLAKIKDNSEDELLFFKIEMLRSKIMNYCNRDDIPATLNNLIVEIISKEYIKTLEPEVSSISRGGVSVSFKNDKENILDDYKSQLNRYRKLGTL